MNEPRRQRRGNAPHNRTDAAPTPAARLLREAGRRRFAGLRAGLGALAARAARTFEELEPEEIARCHDPFGASVPPSGARATLSICERAGAASTGRRPPTKREHYENWNRSRWNLH